MSSRKGAPDWLSWVTWVAQNYWLHQEFMWCFPRKTKKEWQGTIDGDSGRVDPKDVLWGLPQPKPELNLSFSVMRFMPQCRSCFYNAFHRLAQLPLSPPESGSLWGLSSLWYHLSFPAKNLYKCWWEMASPCPVRIKAPSPRLRGIGYCNTPGNLSYVQFSLPAGAMSYKAIANCKRVWI